MPMKVHELAQEYHIDSKALLGHLKELGIFVSSHMSLLDENEVEKVRSTIDHVQKQQSVSEKRVRPTVIRRRVVKSPLPSEETASGEAVQEETAEAEAAPESVEVQPSEAEAPTEEAEAEAESAPAPGVEEEKPAPKQIKLPKDFDRAVVIKKAAPQPEPEPAAATAQQPEEGVGEEAAAGAPVAGEKAVEAEPEPAGAPQAEKKEKRSKAGRARKGKTKAGAEAARIIETPSVEVLERLSAEGVGAAGEAVPRKTKPKKRKALKAFEVVHEEKPRGRAGKKKEVIELRDQAEEPRGYRPTRKKKQAREARQTEVTVPKAIKRKIRMAETITVGELAKRMGVKAADLIKQLIGLGVMATVNQVLDADEAAMVASEFGYEIEKVVSRAQEILEKTTAVEDEANLEPRPPVVTVMGHVDHGKTSILDVVRKTHVTDQEFGGITQHIGAYQASIDGHKITFLDTPGHEAFTSLRARGAQVTDIVVLVVAADDGVMNQTREAIDHARAAKVPIVVAINKIDKADAQPDRVKQELSNLGLVPEDWGGDTLFCEVSAKERTGIEVLLENILLQSEMLELKANPDKPAKGTIIEAQLDRHRGPVATVLIQEGTLHRNDAFVAGAYSGKIRMMVDHRGMSFEEAGPATPVEVMGISGVPQAGEQFIVVAGDKEAKDIETYRRDQLRKEEVARAGRVSLDRLMEQMAVEEIKELPVVIKGDVQGTIETLRDTLSRMGGDKIKIQVIHASVGGITENDVNLASASNAIIIGFNVRPEARAQNLAEELGVDVRIYNVIYELIEDVEKALVGMLEPTREEHLLGRGDVVQTFKIAKLGTIAGTVVQEGRIAKGARARLVRDGVVVYDGKITSLRRYQDDVNEVRNGQDCGIKLENFNDVKVGDAVECYEQKEVAPEL
jgi:translation initiation factor IF-2